MSLANPCFRSLRPSLPRQRCTSSRILPTRSSSASWGSRSAWARFSTRTRRIATSRIHSVVASVTRTSRPHGSGTRAPRVSPVHCHQCQCHLWLFFFSYSRQRSQGDMRELRHDEREEGAQGRAHQPAEGSICQSPSTRTGTGSPHGCPGEGCRCQWWISLTILIFGQDLFFRHVPICPDK